MDVQQVGVTLTITVLAIAVYFMMPHGKNSSSASSLGETDPSIVQSSSLELTKLIEALSSALPDSVILPQDAAKFARSTNSYWAKQECEATPTCIIRPLNVQQLSKAIAILKQEYDTQAGKDEVRGLFAVRGGGHSAVSGAASIRGGILIDLGHLNRVTPSEDGASVAIEAGAR